MTRHFNQNTSFYTRFNSIFFKNALQWHVIYLFYIFLCKNTKLPTPRNLTMPSFSCSSIFVVRLVFLFPLHFSFNLKVKRQPCIKNRALNRTRSNLHFFLLFSATSDLQPIHFSWSIQPYLHSYLIIHPPASISSPERNK